MSNDIRSHASAKRCQHLTATVRLPFCISTYFHVGDFSIPQDMMVGAFGFISTKGHKDIHCFD